MERRGMNRRDFLKMSAAALGGGLPGAVPCGAAASAPALEAGAEPLMEVDSCCQFCQVRCTTKVQVRNGRVVNVFGNLENFWTGGAMCPKGKSVVELTTRPDRITYPLLRDGSGWKRISYADALDLTVERILECKRNHPEDYAHRLALFMPLWESREGELAALMALGMAGFPDACPPGDACIGNTATALRVLLGSSNSTTTLDEVLRSRTLLLWGANIAEIYPPYMRWIVAAREKGVSVVYVDPRRTPTSNFCDAQFSPRPGTDGALALGVAHILLRDGHYDRAYVDAAVDGFDDLARAVEPYTPARTEEITWVPAGEIERLARMIGESDRTLLWLGGSLSRYTNSIQTVRNIVALMAITNNLDGEGRGVMNVQGGKPGGEDEFIERFAAPDMGPGLSFRKVLNNMKNGRVDVLLLNSSYRRYPDANGVRAAIGKVPFVVHRGFFMNEEAEVAHLLIPGTMPFESEGSQYGAQRQVVWRRKAIDRPGETVEDWRFYTDLGRRLNGRNFPEVRGPEDLYHMVCREVPSWRGLGLDRVKSSPTGVTWPCESPDEPERRGSIFRDGKLLTDNGKAQLNFKPLGPIRWHEPEGSPLDAKSEEHGSFPLIFMQGKVVHQWQHTFTNWSEYMGQFSEGNYVLVHPETMQPLGLADGDLVYIETRVGKLEARVKESPDVQPGVVWTPSHPAPASPVPGNRGTPVNVIVPGYWDKVSAQFNGFGCRLVKLT